MCGVIGIIGQHPVAIELYEGLIALQHRGQDSAGITTYDGRFSSKRGMGLVREIYSQNDMSGLKGNIGVGHVRYPTIGGASKEDTQPFIVNYPYGIAMAHNGNVFNFWELKKELFHVNHQLINSDNDVEVILNIIAYELNKDRTRDFFESLCIAVKSVHEKVKGAYSVVAVIAGKGIVAFRDPHGIRPLVWGQRRNGEHKVSHIFASENTMFEILAYDFYRDVGAGEVVFVSEEGEVMTQVITEKEFRPCVFEYVYFARSDAYLNQVSVHRSRLRMGQNLGRKIKKEYSHLPIDVVIPVPQTATTAALSCAHELGVRYTEGIMKNPFIGRTFIMPGPESRKKANRYKLSAIEQEIRNKNILVVDDSIVRGTVSKRIVSLLRKHGAKKVYFASVSPPLKWPDLYGIDTPTRQEYISYQRSIDDIRRELGADELIYQDLEDLIEAVTRRGSILFKKPHCAYFNGDYPTGDIDEEVLEQVESMRTQEKTTKNVK